MISRIVFLFSFLILSTSFASTITNCEYNKTQVIKLNGGSGTSCTQTKLCYADILCTKKLSSGKEIDVSRNIICALDSAGHCPSVETCRNDKTTATFENEAQIGSSGNRDWIAVIGNLTPIFAEAYFRKKNGLPIEPATERIKDIDELKEEANPTGVK